MSEHTTHASTNEIPYGYCHCGCGELTPIATKTRRKYGHIKGQPLRFIMGHNFSGPPRSPEQRFWEKVDKRGTDDCWAWLAATNPAGYGISRSGTEGLAHRAAWAIHNGPIPDGMFVCHRCDNPTCVNPAHLFLGTHSENMQDMDMKGRRVTPERAGRLNGHSRLTEDDIHEIRRRHTEGESQSALSRDYGVSQSHIWHIVHHKRWAHA